MTYGRTRAQLRRSIGRNLIGHRLVVSTASLNDDTTGLVDDTLLGGDDNYNGWWFVATSPGANAGSIRRVSDYDSAGSRLSWTRPLPEGTAKGDSYEMWPSEYPPAVIHDYVDQAISEAAGRIYEPVEYLSLHTGGGTVRLPIPKGVHAISKVQARVAAVSRFVHRFDVVFDETTAPGWKQAVDDTGHREGASSLRIDIPARARNGEFISDSVDFLDLSDSTHLEGWIRSAPGLAAGDIVLHLNAGVVRADGSDVESLDVPGTETGRWTYFRVPLANPWDDGAITSIGIEYNANVGEATLWFDGLRAVDAATAVWRTLPAHLWSIDRADRYLLLATGGQRLAGYAPLKLIGGREPAPLSTDASTTVVPDEFIIARATSLALRASPDSAESEGASSEHWNARAKAAYGAFPLLTNVRRVG